MTAPNAPVSAEEVLPCPFCGDPAHYDPVCDWVSCGGCGATGPTGDEQVSAITAWNARTAVAAMAERHAATERDACLQAERANELASRLAAMAEREAALIVRLKALESEVSARRSGWASFVDDEDPSLLVVAHHDRSVHFTGASAWGDANAFDAARAEARDG